MVIWGKVTLSNEIKTSCLLSRSQCVKNSLRVLAMFGFSLKATEKPRQPAAARAFCTGGLAAVQPSKWAPLEVRLANEKKHRHRNSPKPKKP